MEARHRQHPGIKEKRNQEFGGKRRKKNKGRMENGSQASFTQKPNHNYPLSLLTSLFPPSLRSALLPLSSPSASYHGNRRGAENEGR